MAPDAFRGGEVAGTAYLYGLASGSSATDFESQAHQAVASDFRKRVVDAVTAADKHPVEPTP